MKVGLERPKAGGLWARVRQVLPGEGKETDSPPKSLQREGIPDDTLIFNV